MKNDHRFACNVELTFELNARNEDDAMEVVELMLQFIKSTVTIARSFKEVTWHVPPNQPKRVHPTEVSGG